MRGKSFKVIRRADTDSIGDLPSRGRLAQAAVSVLMLVFRLVVALF
ncbi:hypothetical protein [Saccharibacillus alkalitolerans]|uniref:Uncharacterized protein n=1 Tax=Saccharibacillus alkalitolerans TaxID=2705290 RepID=A0ABX0F7J4_9BACL|nr:hypothetical protein [Saccharibacillus alkalitolerans]NGZ76927.1 hypothetical protein [Saccharibacillus alkalitolerans]